jgi:hypothetical protein
MGATGSSSQSLASGKYYPLVFCFFAGSGAARSTRHPAPCSLPALAQGSQLKFLSFA